MMLASLLAAVALAGPIDEFCSMAPGNRWTYAIDGGTVVDEIGAPVDLGGGKSALPKTSTVNGKSDGAELLSIEGDTLQLVGYMSTSGKKPEIKLLAPPVPIVRIGESKIQWDFAGEVSSGFGPVLQKIHGESAKGPRRQVLGREVDTVVAHLTSRIGNDRNAIEVRQDMVYARGIGLVEMSSATKAQGKTVKNVLKLVRFEPAQG